MKLPKLVYTGLLLLSFGGADARPQDSRPVTGHYADMVKGHYDALNEGAQLLAARAADLVTMPSPATHQAAKEAWLAMRLQYGPAEAYRFYNGPIDNHDSGVEGALNAWPLDEMYIDGTGFATPGIIDQPELYPVIDQELLESLNEVGGEKNIATGFHAIEFLLWGADLNANSAGLRTYEDFVVGVKPFAERRGAYLIAATGLLTQHLAALGQAWDKAQPGSYYNSWQKASEKSKLTRMMTGMATLVYYELASERLFTAVDEGDQEHEHSCFSDMTHIDTMGNLLGAENVYRGRLTMPNFVAPHGEDFHVAAELEPHAGPSLRDYLQKHSKKHVRKLDRKFADAKRKVAAIPTPFDQAILFSKDKIIAAVNALRDLGEEIKSAGDELGLEIKVGAGDGD